MKRHMDRGQYLQRMHTVKQAVRHMFTSLHACIDSPSCQLEKGGKGGGCHVGMDHPLCELTS